MTMRTKLFATTPDFVVSDLQRSIDFYCDKLGFGDPGTWGEPPCFAMMNRDGFDMMLSLADDPADVRPNGPTGVWDLHIRIASLDDELAALNAAGVPIAKGPSDTPYGMREIEVLDPDGYRICFGQDFQRRPEDAGK
jgi:catechol 2,3-dioxygenase-like lactoylglutathione lyase family enzyme